MHFVHTVQFSVGEDAPMCVNSLNQSFCCFNLVQKIVFCGKEPFTKCGNLYNIATFKLFSLVKNAKQQKLWFRTVKECSKEITSFLPPVSQSYIKRAFQCYNI